MTIDCDESTLDPEGNPTRDAALAKDGALLPFGGYKGFGLGLVVQLFGELAGASLDLERDNAVFILAFRPDLLMPADQFRKQASALLVRVKETPRQDGVEDIRLPSERAFRSREQLRRTGIEVDRAVYDGLMAL